MPKGAPDYLESVEITFPSGRTADEICPTEIAVPVWCAHMGTLTFHPWPVRRADVDRPDELRIDLDPQPGTSFADAVRVAGVARELLEELGLRRLPEDLGQPRRAHLRPDRAASGSSSTSGTPRSGSAASWPGATTGVTMNWWKEERGERIFVDFNQNSRDRTIASAYSLRPIPGAPVSTPMTWDELAGVTDPREFNLFTVPERLRRRRPVGGDRRHGVLARAAAAALGGAAAAARCRTRRTTRRCRASRRGCSRARRSRRTGTRTATGSGPREHGPRRGTSAGPGWAA